MNSRLSAISLVCAGLAVAAIPGFASSTKTPPPTVNVAPISNYTFAYNGQTQREPWTGTKPKTAEERNRRVTEAAKAKVKEPTIKKASPTMWTAQYKLYVNCPTAPSDLNFTGPFAIQAAVNAALQYTTIQVCYGFEYSPAVVVNKSYVKIVGQGDHQGDQTILGFGPGFGILITGSYDIVENMTFQDLEFGVVTGVLIQNEYNVVDQNWFNTVGLGVGSLLGNNMLIENNTFSLNIYPIVDAGGVDETITGNTITGNAALPFIDSDGIALYDSIDSTVTNNIVGESFAGLDFELSNSFATVENNHLDGNAVGVYNVDFNSGNLFEKNQVNGNFYVGIYSDDTTGLDDFVSGTGVNKFEKNTTLGNGSFFGGCTGASPDGCDIYDATAGFAGPSQGNNEETANYYTGNTGDTFLSWPADIYQL
jgi:hypothetical protein